MDQPSLYNKFVAEGLTKIKENDFDLATKMFTNASNIFPLKSDPFFYIAITLIMNYYDVISKSKKNKEIKLLYFRKALKNFDKACDLNKFCSNLYFYRGIIRF